MSEKIKKTIGPKGIRWLIWSIYIIMVITIIVSWVFYPEDYDFWELSTSTLGGLITPVSLLPNFPSYMIFTIGFVLMGGIAILTAVLYFKNTKKFRFAIIKGVLLVIMGIGAVGIAIPHDYVPLTLFHQIGAFMFLSGLAALNGVYQLLHCMAKYAQCEDRNVDFYVDYTFVVLLIIAAVMYYATEVIFYLWPTGWWIRPPMMQKILLFTAIIAAGLLDLDDIK